MAMISNENVLMPQKRKNTRLALQYQVCEFAAFVIMSSGFFWF